MAGKSNSPVDVVMVRIYLEPCEPIEVGVMEVKDESISCQLTRNTFFL